MSRIHFEREREREKKIQKDGIYCFIRYECSSDSITYQKNHIRWKLSADEMVTNYYLVVLEKILIAFQEAIVLRLK